MANEWPADDSIDWDDAISANLTTGGSHNASTGLHGFGVLSAFKTVFVLDGVALSSISDNDTTVINTVGFQPRQMIFFGSVASTSGGSWGISGGVESNFLIYQGNDGVMNKFTTSDYSILLEETSGSGQARGRVTAVSSTGFTITWQEQNTLSSGTATVIALCLK